MNDSYFLLKLTANAVQFVGEIYFSLLHRRFLTIGFAGTGKTVLLQSVARARIDDDPTFPTYATQSGTARIGDTRLVVTDTAGNPATFDTIVRREVEKAQVGQYLGILNVTAFGYNEARGATIPGYDLDKRHNVAPYLDDQGTVNPDFLEIERQQEMDFLEMWLPVASATGNIGWIFCAINKFDLWRDHPDQAMEYYGADGAYGQRIKNEFGNQWFRDNYETSPVCAALSNFFGRAPRSSQTFTQRNAADLNKLFVVKLEDRLKRRQR